ncbi:MAG: YigZ family protein [Cyclobacteriaceae bacterium]|nr:YigZ family protein [Cyclobacteriaceae bacterium]
MSYFSLTQNEGITLHNPQFSFKTIREPATGSYKEKGSKFLAFAYPVHSEAEIRDRLEALKKKYFDARHHCFAWMLGPGKQKFRAFDDGEPNHSAGDPILGQIRSHELTNILIVVVRYFGGVKLGVGGLIGAYRAAAADTLANAIVIEEEVTDMLEIRYDYAVMPEIMRLVKANGLRISAQEFSQENVMKVICPLRIKGELLNKLERMRVDHPILLFRIANEEASA